MNISLLTIIFYKIVKINYLIKIYIWYKNWTNIYKNMNSNRCVYIPWERPYPPQRPYPPRGSCLPQRPYPPPFGPIFYWNRINY